MRFLRTMIIAAIVSRYLLLGNGWTTDTKCDRNISLHQTV